MSMRIFDKKIAGLALLPLIAMLAACGSGAEDEAEKPVGAAERTAEQNASAKPDNEGKLIVPLMARRTWRVFAVSNG